MVLKHLNTFVCQMLFRRFYSGSSSDDSCSMMFDRNVINRRNVKVDPHTAYQADRDFLILEVTARIIAAAYQVLGLESETDKPNNFPIPEDMSNQSNMKKQQYLHAAAAKIVDELVVNNDMINSSIETMLTTQQQNEIVNQQVLNEEGRFPCRFPGCLKTFKYNGKSRRKHEQSHDPPVGVADHDPVPTPSTTECLSSTSPTHKNSDDVFSYNTALLAEGLFFMNFLDSISQGDGDRILRQYKYLMLHCKADGSHSTKYALECLFQLLLINGGLSKSEAEVFTWNRSVNTRGRPGANIPFDLEVEHSNNYIKQAIGNLGVNVTESAVTRISRAEKAAREIIFKLDTSLQNAVRSGKHVRHFPKSDFDEIVKRLVGMGVFKPQDGRHYRHYRGFERDPLKALDMSRLYKWINDHKKKLALGIKAR